LQISLIVYDYCHNTLETLHPKKNQATDTSFTGQHNLVYTENSRTQFSSKLRKHHFTKLPNKV